MRFNDIRSLRVNLGERVQDIVREDISDRVSNAFYILGMEPLKRKMARFVGGAVTWLNGPVIKRRIGLTFPFRFNRLTLGERFAADVSKAALLRKITGQSIDRVLIPGCYMAGEDVQFWLRRGVKHLCGVDVYSLERHWSEIIPKLQDAYRTDINFRQGSIEALPFANESFDIITSSAVLEHVRNQDRMVAETARVLRTGGLCWHGFGPLYYSFGGDHCIAAYGLEHGYDHLLLEDRKYRRLINNQKFFDGQTDPNLPFWARHDQFSFAKAADYLKAFEKAFEVEHVVVIISPESLEFRKKYAVKWRKLLESGISEADLIIKSLFVVLRKR